MVRHLKYHHKVWCLLAVHASIYCYTLYTDWSILAFLGAHLLALVFHWVGNECGLHRLWAHRSYTTSRWKEVILHLFALPLLYGTSLTYTCVHRQHHRESDTQHDSHVLKPWWGVALYLPNAKHPVDQRLCIDLMRDPLHIDLHKNYFYLNWLLLILVFCSAGPQMTGWTLSAIVVHNFVLGGLINVLGHKKHATSYRSHRTGDNSYNSRLLQALTMNQGLHNNHHRFPSRWNFACQPGEIDVPAFFIKTLLKG